MKASTIHWHLSRAQDTRIGRQRLARFCEKNKSSSFSGAPYPQIGRDEWFFNIEYHFDNGAMITAQLMAGHGDKGYTVADHFEILEHLTKMGA